MKICLIGGWPPPYGGVSVHIQRVAQQLSQRGMEWAVIDISGVRKNVSGVSCTRWRYAVLRLLFARKAVLHFHNFSSLNIIIYFLLGLRHTTILTFHNVRFAEQFNQHSRIVRKLLLRLLSKLDCVIATSDKCGELLRRITEEKCEVTLCPAFIPPAETTDPLIPERILDLRKSHEYLISSNATDLAFYRGDDIYGIDLLIEMTARLVQEEKLDVAVVVLLPRIGNPAYYQKLRSRIAQLGIEGSFHFVTEAVVDAWAVWRMSDLVIRATNTDTTALTIDESLWCGTPVIASDAVPRQKEVVLFANRDLEDLVLKTKTVISDLDNHKLRLETAKRVDNAEKLLAIYSRFQEVT